MAAAASGSRSETFLAGEAAGAAPAVFLARIGVPASLLILAPTVLPPLFLAAVALLVYAACPDREQAPVAASLWLAFSTGDLETVRGMGIVPGLWSHPWSAAVTAALVLLALVPLSGVWRGVMVSAAGLILLRTPPAGGRGRADRARAVLPVAHSRPGSVAGVGGLGPVAGGVGRRAPRTASAALRTWRRGRASPCATRRTSSGSTS